MSKIKIIIGVTGASGAIYGQLLLKKLEELIIEEEKEYDPRWDELKKLINNN